MSNIKSIETLRGQLTQLEQDTMESIQSALLRINRTVYFSELGVNPFVDNVRCFMEAIQLDADGNIVIETSFADVHEKTLAAIISDGEIDHWSMLYLLGLLQDME